MPPASAATSSSGTPPPLVTVQTRLQGSYTAVVCVHCQAALEYPTPAAKDPFQLQCAQCHQTWIVRPAGKPKPKARRLGTDAKPLDMSFYDLLEVGPTATQDEIKRAYRKFALKYHPDKNLGDAAAGEMFRDIAVAYSTLSDEGLRHTYNEFGKGKGDGAGEDTMVDPEAMFSQLFGGERFLDIIGSLSLGTEMKSAMQEDDDEEDATPSTSTSVAGKGTDSKTLTPQQREARDAKRAAKALAQQILDDKKAAVREVRVQALIEKLRNKIAVFSEQATSEDDTLIASGVRTMWTIEAEELKHESYGAELLNTVGFVYSSKSTHFLASSGPIPFGLGGWFHSARSTAHIFSETISTARSAYALKDVFEALSAAEAAGDLTPEKKKELEDKAASMGLHALFKGAKLEVESVIREVCDRLLSEPVPLADLRKRAVAIGILGSVFEAVTKDGTAAEAILPGATPAPAPSSKRASK